MKGGFKRVAILAVLVVIVVVAAYILGSATGAYLRGREQRKIDGDYVAKRQAETREMVEAHGSALKTGATLPNHSFTDLEGNPVSLYEVLTEKTVITVFSTNCDFCEEEMALLKKHAKRDADWEAFVFISGDSAQALVALRDTIDTRMRVLYDENFQFSSSFFGFVPLPLTIIVDENATIEDFMAGKLTEREVKDILSFHRERRG